jgi:hypothetical protein
MGGDIREKADISQGRKQYFSVLINYLNDSY